MLGNLFANYYEAISMILFGIGFTTLLLNRNMIKKIMGLNIMDTAIYLFLAAKGYIFGRKVPIVTGTVPERQELTALMEADVEDEIPPTSLVREFIGGNSYYK